MTEDLAGKPFRGDKRYAVGGCVERRPALRSLIDDDRIYGPVVQLIGPEVMWWASEGTTTWVIRNGTRTLPSS